MAHDLVASFYGGYEQVGLVHGRRWRIPRTAVLITVAVLVLVIFIAADVAAYENLTATVDVTAVDWVSEGTVLATTAGFALHPDQKSTLTLLCSTVCIRFDGASVSGPFTLVAFSVTYQPDQYTTVTVQAPGGAYSGVLTITLAVEAPAADGAVD